MRDVRRPRLTLAELQAHDPLAPPREPERRYLCPLIACRDKQHGSRHRSLVVNLQSGAWKCHRCGESGWLDQHGPSARAVRQARLDNAFKLGTNPVHVPRDSSRAGLPVERQTRPWIDIMTDAIALHGTPGATYLAQRGIPLNVATDAGARFHPKFLGQAAVVFPVRDSKGYEVAVIGRYVNRRAIPKARAVGARSCGVFTTPGSFKNERLVIVEAPIDALSLTVAGMPAIALGGTSVPSWLPPACSFRKVVLALDADDAGDAASETLTARFQLYGARIERWRPSGGVKDWNDLLVRLGPDRLHELLVEAMEPVDSD